MVLALPADLPPLVSLALDGEPLPVSLWPSVIGVDHRPHHLAARGSSLNT